MKLFEYQAKRFFAQAGIKIPRGNLLCRQNDFISSTEVNDHPSVLKAQLLEGKRGKAGFVKIVKTRDEFIAGMEDLLNNPRNIKSVLAEEFIESTDEIYLSINIDPQSASALVMSSKNGGADIEKLAAECPERIIRKFVSLERGIMNFQCREIAYFLGLQGKSVQNFVSVLTALYSVFRDHDAEFVEINPLFLTRSGELIAGDGKLSIDDNAFFRQADCEIKRDCFENDIQYEAYTEGMPYLQFDGDIALMCAGAGLTTTVYDLVNYEGGSVACYLEFGGPNYKKASRALELCMKNKSLKVILIVSFGTIARADIIAEGVCKAMEIVCPNIPIVICIRGTNEESATGILKEHGMNPISDTESAVREAVALSKEVAS